MERWLIGAEQAFTVGHSVRQETLAQYKQYLEQSGLSPVTVGDYVRDIRDLAMWLTRTGKGALLEATYEHIRAYPVELATDKGYSAATVNRRVQSIRKFYRYALESELIEEDVSSGIKLLPQPKTQGTRSLNEAEVERFLKTVQNGTESLAKRDYAIVQLMLQTGIRVGELTSLQVSDLSLSQDKGALKVRAKGNAMSREIPLNNSARTAMVAYLEERPQIDSDWLFLSRRGDPLSVRSVQRLVSTYAQAAGLKEVSTYTLRQTCGEHLWRQTGDLPLVARLMGHKRLETAIKYVAATQEDVMEVGEGVSCNHRSLTGPHGTALTNQLV